MELKLTPTKLNISEQQIQSYCKRIEAAFPNFYFNFKNFRHSSHCKAKAYSKTVSKVTGQFYQQEINLFREQLTKLGKKYAQKCKQVECLKANIKQKEQQIQKKNTLNSEVQSMENLKKYHLIEKEKMMNEHERRMKETQMSKQMSMNELSHQYELTIKQMNHKQQILNSQIGHLENQMKEMESFIYEVSETEKSEEHSVLRFFRKQRSEVQKQRSSYKSCLEITSLKMNIQNLKEENSMLRSYIEQQDIKLRKIESQPQNSQKIKYLQKEIEELNYNLKLERLRLKQQQKIEEQKVKGITLKHEEILQAKNREISQLNQKIHELKMQYDLKSSKIQQQYEIEARKSTIFEQNLQEKINILESQEKNRESLRNSRKEESHIHYKSLADSRSRQVQHLYLELSNFKNKQKKCYQEIDQLRKCKIDMSYENSRLQNTVDLLRSEVIDLQNKLNERSAQKDQKSKSSKRGQTITEIIIQEDTESLKESLRISKGQHKFVEQELKNEISLLKSQLQAVIAKNQGLLEEKQLLLVCVQQKQSEKQSWETLYTNLVEEFQEGKQKSEGEVFRLEDKICKLEIENCDMKAKEEVYQLQKTTNIAHIKKLEEEQEKLIKLTIYIRELEESYAHAEQKSQKVQILEGTLMQTKIAHAKEISSYEIQISELHTSLQTHQQRVHTLQQELEQMKSQLQQNSNRFDEQLHEKDELVLYLKQNYSNIMKKLEEIEHEKKELLETHEEEKRKHQEYQITTTRQKQKIKYFQMQITDLKQYIMRITEEKQKLHEYIQNINDFFYGKCMEMSTYNKNLMESAQNFSFRKMKVQEFLAEKKCIQVVEQGQLQNLSEVITIPDFSEKKELIQDKSLEQKMQQNNSERKHKGRQSTN